ncbi:MAG: DedD protein [Lysobacterales bacterium]|jgi:DedD protein
MDKALKQRLVGASVLIALAVVVLPMLLSGQPDSQQETQSIDMPPKPSELSFETRRFPVGDQARDEPSTVEVQPYDSSALNEASSQVLEPDIANPEVETVDIPPETIAPSSSVAQNAVELPGPGRYLVQVASFSTTSNANRLSARLKEDGLEVIMDTIDAAVGTLHRVRVGPYDRLDQANEAMSLIRSRTPDVNPRVIDIRPDESAPVTDPSDPLVRWVVQVGSFENQVNAEGLVSQLRTKGFSAYSIAVTESGRSRYKVRVGPEIERESAIRIAEDIREELELDGMVISVD